MELSTLMEYKQDLMNVNYAGGRKIAPHRAI
jgi:hypothetical protein